MSAYTGYSKSESLDTHASALLVKTGPFVVFSNMVKLLICTEKRVTPRPPKVFPSVRRPVIHRRFGSRISRYGWSPRVVEFADTHP